MNSNKLVQYWENPKIVDEVDRAAVKCGINRSSFIRQAVRKELKKGAQQ